MWKLLTPCVVALLIVCTAATSIATWIGSTKPSLEIAYLVSTYPNSWLHSIDVNHGLSYRITNAPVLNNYFAWSPDGTQLVFVSDVVVSTEIFVASVDRHSLRQITIDAPHEYFPTWSTDSRHIAFGRQPAVGEAPPEIYVMNVEDRTERTLTQDAAAEFQLVWSPDGTQIAYIAVDTTSIRIRIIDAETGTFRAEVNEIFGNFDHLSWSPDSTKLIFTVYDIFSTIYVMEFATNRIIRLTSPNQNNYLPVWSSDGQHIAFVSDRDLNSEIYVMDANGENQRRLTFNSTADLFPAWSPDNNRIAFSTTDNQGNSSIYLINADGSNLQRITMSRDGYEWLPRWRP
jgi:Tol biopolymer transport system component